MSDKEKADELTRKISASKKYKTLYYKTVERVVKNYLKAKTGGGPSSAEISTDKVEKRTRNLLHQIWGAYFPNRPNFEKLSDKLKESLKFGRGLASRVPAKLNSQRIKEIILPFLNLQSSIKERVPILDGFYQKIFAITGQPKTIIDWACGLNPLSWPWMNLPEDCHYIGFDIDKEQNNFLNGIFKITGLKQFETRLGDILIDKSPSADIIFLLKLLPLLEHQQKGISLEILKKLSAKFLVVSFPTHSIGGKQKNMIDFYDKWFHDLVKDESWRIGRIIFPTELVFIIKKT